MVASTVLPMLYEFLVSESRYEVRGSEYRARLKALFDDLMCAQLAFPKFDVSSMRQSNFKMLDELVNSVGFADCGDMTACKLGDISCPGIRQYVYPAIPNFNRLDAEFLKLWHHFFGFIDMRDRSGTGTGGGGGRNRRSKGLLFPSTSSSSSSGGGDTTAEESFSETESTASDRDNIDAIITADDILCPRIHPEELDALPLSAVTSSGHTSTSATHEITTTTTTTTTISDDHDHFMHHKVPFYMDSTYKIDKGAVVFGLMNDVQLGYEWSCNKPYSAYASLLKSSMADTDVVDFDDGASSATLMDVDEEEDEVDYSDVSDDDDNEEDDADDCDDYSDRYDPKSIFGNYYCPRPRNHKPKFQKDQEDITLEKPEVSSINYTSFTLQAMEVTSMMYVGSDGTPHVSCVGTLGERCLPKPYSGKVKYHNRQSNIQHRLESAISGVFAIKNAISAHCSRCSGWSLNNGCSIILCESCEHRLINEFDPVALNRLFDLRRDLMSELYPAIGYQFVDSEAKKSDKGDSGSTYVTIPALCEIGGTYPKASLHDGRYQPNSLDIPMNAVQDLSSIVYTNAELQSYAECNSGILEICRQRRQHRIQAFNNYLEGLVKLYNSSIAHASYPLIIKEFNQVFKHGLLPCPSNGVDNKRQYFDEVTSSMLFKLPLDVNMLRKSFYRRGAYGGKPDSSSSSHLLALADEDRQKVRGKHHPPVYSWHEVALKHWVRRAPTDDQAVKAAVAKPTTSCLKPGIYLDFVNRTGTLDRMPREYVNRLHQTGRLDVGFPTSLEMHLLDIPDSVLDPSMYSKSGMAFLFSLPSIMQNLCALSALLRVSDSSNDNHKRRAKETVLNKTVS